MASGSVKELVQRLFADNEFRRAFLEAPEEVLARQSLAAEEQRALLRLRSRLATADGPEAESGPLGFWP